MIKILSGLIPNKKWRRNFRVFWYAMQIRHTAKSIGKNLYCSTFCKVNKNTIIKDNVRFNSVKITGSGDVTIGNGVVVGFDTLIISSSHNYKGEQLPYDRSDIKAHTEIGDFAWIGARVTILPGTKIGEGAIIQAGSVVHGEIPPLAIAGGNPATVFKYRDEEHYYKLKNENKIFAESGY